MTVGTALLNYYDRDLSGQLVWMKVSLWSLVVLSLIVPFGIFFSGDKLMGLGLYFYLCMPYMVDRFCYYVKSGITQPVAAAGMGIPKYLLTDWLGDQHTNYNDWLAHLRIDEAKRVIREHPDWSNETVADHCGFKDRAHFQNKFKEITGQTPAEWVAAV